MADHPGSPITPRWLTPANLSVSGAVVLGIAIVVAIAGLHLLGWAFILRFNSTKPFGQTFFPAAGVTLAALLFLPRQTWWLVLGATFASEFATDFGLIHQSLGTAFGEALANTIEPAVGAILILAWTGTPPVLTRRRDLTAFLVGGVLVGPAIGALVGATSIGDFGAYLTVLSRWWTGDALGVLVVGGAIIAGVTDASWPVRPRHPAIEMAIGTIGLGLVTWAVFWHWQPALAFLTLPIVGWASFRFGARGATMAGLVVVMMAQWATATSHGLFAVVAGANHSLALWLLQAFLGIVIVMGLILASQVAELGRTEHALHSAELAEREARLEADRVLAAERARLAIELHDAVGHAVSVMVLQAGAARMTMSEGEESALAIRSIEETGRVALTELDRLLGLIEGAGTLSNGNRQPALRLKHLDRLLENVRATGLDVTLKVPDGLPTCSSALDHSAYRIIQEALTNAVKHAGASRVEVTVSCPTGDFLEIGVADDGANNTGDGGQIAADGRGLIGMRERVASFGGDLHAGPSPSGGWRVEVSLPLSE